MAIYIDTNLLVAYYCDEPISEKAQDILNNIIEERIISNLSIVEFFSALSKKTRCAHVAKAQLDASSATKIETLFESHIRKRYFKKINLTNKNFRQECDISQ